MGGRQRTTIFIEKESGKKEARERQAREAAQKQK